MIPTEAVYMMKERGLRKGSPPFAYGGGGEGLDKKQCQIFALLDNVCYNTNNFTN